jgi:hypothetical protein
VLFSEEFPKRDGMGGKEAKVSKSFRVVLLIFDTEPCAVEWFCVVFEFIFSVQN